jgi:hypothetical protein
MINEPPTIMARFIIMLFFIGSSFPLYSQDRCSIIEYEKWRKSRNPKLESNDAFENWMKQRISVRRMEAQRTEDIQSIYTIPVVVHIIHNDEPVGSGTNLSEAQILSQIEVLNKDFKRLNSDAANTPAEFAPVAGSIDVEFVLAKQDPFGAPTNGIVRVKGTQESWSVNENAAFKALSYWPAENYLNIWVVKFNDNTVGFSQFPVSNLSGLSGSPEDRLTDGVAISYRAFGSIDFGSFNLDEKYNKGRTLTHEVGHFLGLRHIWGDDGSSCSGTDYVDDTPNQGGSYVNQCPTSTRSSCSSNDMYMNFMDYTNDACMNLFTIGQIGRISVVLQNSPRRASLLTSNGANAPTPLSFDVALKKIITPGSSVCGDPITPVLEIQNLGSSKLTSVTVEWKLNNAIVETTDLPVNLDYLQSTTLTLSTITPPSTSLQFNFNLTKINGVADERPQNNQQQIATTIPPSRDLPISESFTALPTDWSIHNPDNLKTWQVAGTQNSGSAIYINCFDYDNTGAVDQLMMPVLDLTHVSAAFLYFDRAYAPYDNTYYEQLKVLVSPLCDFNNSQIKVLHLSGNSLATAPASKDYFYPDPTQWKTEIIDLSAFIGSKIQIAFEAVNGYGNNLYLDNVIVLSDQFVDLAIESLESPAPVSCNNSIIPQLKIKNIGTTAVTHFKIRTSVNNQPPVVQQLSGLDFKPGAVQTFTLNGIDLADGLNSITFTVSEPNGFADNNSSNDQISVRRIINNTQEIIPYRQNFNTLFQNEWSIISQPDQQVWVPASTNKLTSMLFPAFNYNKSGEESWLVSPVFDFSRNAEASMFFDISYGLRFTGNERLRVLYSDDCGITYKNVLYDKSGSTLSNTSSNAPWKPSQDADWRRDFINLNALAGLSNLRFAFVATTNYGNNVYLDNIEFFIDDNADPITIKESFSVYGVVEDVRVTFNLKERQPVDLQIYNAIGQLVLDDSLPETLNQTYYFDLGHFSSGIYIFRVKTAEESGAVRVYLGRRN